MSPILIFNPVFENTFLFLRPMFDPVYIEINDWLVHSFRPQEMKRLKTIAADVYAILSDEKTLTFLPEKRMASREHAESFLKGSLLGYHSGKNYLHFIAQKSSGKIIGMIDLISPETAKQYYVMADYPYFIEFYLGSAYQRQGVMSALLPRFIGSLKKKKVGAIAAIANRYNDPASNTLIKAGFTPTAAFDPFQDLYTYTG